MLFCRSMPEQRRNDIESSSERLFSACASTRRGTRSDSSARFLQRQSRAHRIPSSVPSFRNRKPRSAPVVASAASSTAFNTSSIEYELCSVRPISSTALSLPEVRPHQRRRRDQFRALHQPRHLGGIREKRSGDRNPELRIRSCREFSSVCRLILRPFTNNPCRLPTSSRM